jgi:protein deglycase
MIMKRAAVLFADGFEEVEGLTPVDLLRRSGMEVQMVGVTGMRVTGGHDIVVDVDVSAEEAKGPFDAVVIPGGMPGASHVAESRAAVALIKGNFERGALVAAICAAPAVVLEPLGLIKGKRVTCYPGFETRIVSAAFEETRVVVDGNIITSRGPGTAAEFSVAIIQYLLGAEKADEVRTKTLTILP